MELGQEKTPVDLLHQFTPVLWLHSQEEFFPLSFEEILESSRLYDGKNRITLPKETENLLVYQHDHPEAHLRLEISPRIYGGADSDTLHLIPVYGTFYRSPSDEDTLFLQYSFLFPFNGAYRICECECCESSLEAGAHPGDLEHLTLETKNGRLIRAYYSAHGSKQGEWLSVDQIPREQGRPIVYLALGSHGCYWKPATWYRGWGLINDRTNRGYRWDPPLIIFSDDKSDLQDWNNFRGLIGEVPAPQYHDWYHHENEKSISWWMRLFCPCC